MFQQIIKMSTFQQQQKDTDIPKKRWQHTSK